MIWCCRCTIAHVAFNTILLPARALYATQQQQHRLLVSEPRPGCRKRRKNTIAQSVDHGSEKHKGPEQCPGPARKSPKVTGVAKHPSQALKSVQVRPCHLSSLKSKLGHKAKSPGTNPGTAITKRPQSREAVIKVRKTLPGGVPGQNEPLVAIWGDYLCTRRCAYRGNHFVRLLGWPRGAEMATDSYDHMISWYLSGAIIYHSNMMM